MKAEAIWGGCTTQLHTEILPVGPSLENKEEGEEGSARVGFDKME